MNLEKQVANLELSKKLEELGVKQESFFWWYQSDDWYVGNIRERETAIEMFDVDETYSAYTVAELGELLPETITAEQLNKRFPYKINREKDYKNDDELIEEEQKITDDFKSIFNELDDYEDYTDGFSYPMKVSFNRGKRISYHWVTEEWECNYETVEVEADTEANARAQMLIYLIKHKIIEV